MENGTITSGWLSPAQAGRRLNVTPQWARKLAEAGKVRAIRTSLGWLFDEADVDRLFRERDARRESANTPNSPA
ncbi:MAG: helix-turn-helix domain-containing protein [Planctomycetes bacterium]|nr:helix-turn-helix domain-containing protein [Planctomycetota bacterium]MBI3843242.1 helix-turn-helix domain-containing protein [Planctomycetota bacterium]